jgi:DNA polymerase-1
MKPSLPEAYRLFHDGTLALAQMEHNGIRVDETYLDRTINKATNGIAAIEEKIKQDPIWKKTWTRRFGDRRNLDSPQQLGEVVFRCLGHKTKGLTATGKFSTDEAAFVDIQNDVPFVKWYFEAKKLKKVLGTYLNGIKRETVNGFLHPVFSLAGGSKEDEGKGGAISYRGSSSLPNFQNFPIRNPEMAALIRPTFIARDGHQLVEVDYSTLEVRVAACYCKDPTLIEYMKDDKKDMHRDTACDLFFLDEKEVEKKGARDAAKNMFVFPQFYGSYYVDCARAIWEGMERRKFKIEGSKELVIDRLRENGIRKLGKCDPDESPVKGTFEYHVKEVEKLFWEERFSVYTKAKKQWWKEYLKQGYFDLYTGFRCEGLYRRNQVLNWRVQGAAFHCLLQSIVWLTKVFRKRKLRSRIVGQIHDSLLIDAHPNELEEVLRLCKRVMTVELPKLWRWMRTVPFLVEADVSPVGKSWHEKKAVTIP